MFTHLFYIRSLLPPHTHTYIYGECCVWSLSLFHFEIRVVCVWELVYVCACEHKFGVATNHGKF